jgi:hypothetical protein
MSRPTTERRERMTLDRAAMRRVRLRYLRRVRPWLESDRERVYDLGERMRELGLYAKTTAECDIRSGILSNLAWIDGADKPKLRWAWLLRTGWSAYYGWSKSQARREKARSA